MDSSFLTVIHIGLVLYALVSLVKLIMKFGLPNHPSRFLSYVVCLSVFAYFMGLTATELGYVSPWSWMKFRSLPLIMGSLCLLFQVIMTISRFSLFQQKLISRMPIIGALLCAFFFQEKAGVGAGIFIFAGALFFIMASGKARYEKRQYLKMTLFLLFWIGLRSLSEYWTFMIAETFLFFILFYLYLFQEATGVSALVADIRESNKEEPA